MRSKNFLISYLIALLIISCFCEEDDKKKWKRAVKQNETKEKKEPYVPKELNLLTKSNSCVQFINMMIAKDTPTFEKLYTRTMEIDEELGEEDAKNAVMSYILVNCVNLMDNTEFMLLRSMAKARIDIDFSEYEKSLRFEEVKNMILKNDTKLLDEYKVKLDKYEKDYKYALQEYQDRDGKDAFRGRGDIGVFGNKLKDIPKAKKNMIGYGLLLVVVVVMGFMTYRLIKKDKKEKKKKDKKKK